MIEKSKTKMGNAWKFNWNKFSFKKANYIHQLDIISQVTTKPKIKIKKLFGL